ncbi:MAG: hypothetical protein IPO09_02185 [Anaeromyxobacter sp.]|nr:hypothetical protein [Anaeromyxobacter sp.]
MPGLTVRSAILSSLLAAAAACGGSSDPSPNEISISPATVTVPAGGAGVTFTVQTGAASTFGWSLAPGLGTLSSQTATTVVYTPPATVGASTQEVLSNAICAADASQQPVARRNGTPTSAIGCGGGTEVRASAIITVNP